MKLQCAVLGPAVFVSLLAVSHAQTVWYVDADGDGLRDDSCTWWSCTGSCVAQSIVFADIGGGHDSNEGVRL